MKLDVAPVLGPIAEEVARKLADSLQGPARAEAELGALCLERFGAAAGAELERALRFVRSLPCRDVAHPPLEIYLTHPLRVACLVTRLAAGPKLETLLTAVLHNVYEVSGANESELVARGFPERLARGVRRLTIDRRYQSDPGYLREFYAAIEEFGEDLALVRCVDKLDNVLEAELIPDDRVRAEYLELADRFVAPMARRLSPELGRYFEAAVAYMRPRPCRTDLRRQYDRLVEARRREAVRS